MALHTLPAVVRRKKRLGRGIGSRGATSGRGMKGQKARAGYRRRAGFEGGQTPLYIRLPKGRGTKQVFASQVRKPTAVPVAMLDRVPGEVIGYGALRAAGLLPRAGERVKLVGGGRLRRAVTVRVHHATAAAAAAVRAAGGKVEIIHD